MSLTCAWAQTASLSLNEVVSRMEATQAAARDRAIPYSVTRRFILSDNDPKTPDSQVTAQVDIVPPSQRDFTLGKSEGGDRVEKVVRKILNHEAEMAAHADRGEISSRNYEFTALGEQTVAGHRCYLLGLKPRREVPELVAGKAWIDASDYKIRRIEGDLAKAPSFWLKNVHVSLEYGEVLGMWLQLDSRATADVRLMGQHVLTSKAIDVRVQNVVANNVGPSHPSRARRSVANSALWIAR